jgi:membrane-bound inhibitor of C-type lysozyme
MPSWKRRRKPEFHLDSSFAGLDPAIHPLPKHLAMMDGRIRSGHDGRVCIGASLSLYLPQLGETMNRRSVIFILGALFSTAVTASPAAAETFQTYVCSDGTQFVAAFYPYDTRRAHLQVDGKAVALVKRIALSGSRYSGGGVTLTMGKAGTTLKVGKRPVTACSKQ